MALTPEEEAKVRTIIGAYDNGKTIEDLPLLSALNGGEFIELMKGGTSYRANTAMLAAAQPDASGIYPDVPLNRVTIKRTVGQLSTQVVLDDNLGLIDQLKKGIYPCLVDRNSQVVARLNGSDMTKTADGLPAVLNDWTTQVMTLMGGFYQKYEYDASTNTKIIKVSPYKVRGYKYVKRRFRGCFNGTVENVDGSNKLLSNADKWTTQNISLINYHAYAKNLGEHFRAVATQDREVMWIYFLLFKGTYNSQSIYQGITNVNGTNWATFNQSAAGGQSTYAQFHKTGVVLDILGHEGEKTITVAGFPAGDITVKPNKFLWCENALSGPYWLRETGYLKRNRVWYRVNDLKNIDFSITANYEAICEDPEGDSNGWINETFEDTLIPTLLGGSSSTGLADHYYRPESQPAAQIYVPSALGNASYGLYAGLSSLNSNNAPSNTGPTNGSALASDDPTDEQS